MHLATRSGPRRRAPAAAVAAALATMIATVAPATADQHQRTAEPLGAFGLGAACPPGQVPVAGFVDVPSVDPHLDAIACVEWYGVAEGGPADRPAEQYGPALAVPRSQMATFITRLVDTVDPALLGAWDGANRFTDVSDDDVHVEAINRLAAAGLARGGPGGLPADRYGPDWRVSRAQMASFINRAIGIVQGEPLGTADVYFDDLAGVDPDHAANVNALAANALVQGHRIGTRVEYDPSGPVRRNQMASFLGRTMSWLEAHGPGRFETPVRVVASSTTPLVPGQSRNVNIHLAADLIDGSVIPPGGAFSLNDGIGPRTRERGFVENGFISDGDVISTVGGGVSQMATTFVNAAWSAGIDITEFRPHSIYFPRYPMCREATLAWGQLDVVVVNDSPYDIVVATSHTASSVTVSFVSTGWTRVDSWIGAPYATGAPGGPFSVDCGRTITYPDGTDRSERFTWRYNEGFPG